jgi:hypothetical protein
VIKSPDRDFRCHTLSRLCSLTVKARE